MKLPTLCNYVTGFFEDRKRVNRGKLHKFYHVSLSFQLTWTFYVTRVEPGNVFTKKSGKNDQFWAQIRLKARIFAYESSKKKIDSFRGVKKGYESGGGMKVESRCSSQEATKS